MIIDIKKPIMLERAKHGGWIVYQRSEHPGVAEQPLAAFNNDTDLIRNLTNMIRDAEAALAKQPIKAKEPTQ